MRQIGDLLGEVLANTAKLVAERKAEAVPRAAQVIGGTVSADFENAGVETTVRFNPCRLDFTTDATDPAARGCGPKTSGGRTDRNL